MGYSFIFSEIEQKILSENRKILLRNAFLGKFDRSQMKEVDNAIAIVKEAKAETEKALEVSSFFLSGTGLRRMGRSSSTTS